MDPKITNKPEEKVTDAQENTPAASKFGKWSFASHAQENQLGGKLTDKVEQFKMGNRA